MLCSKKYLEEEFNFLLDIFLEKRHGRNYLNSIAKEIWHQAPKTENRRQQNRQIIKDANYKTKK